MKLKSNSAVTPGLQKTSSFIWNHRLKQLNCPPTEKFEATRDSGVDWTARSDVEGQENNFPKRPGEEPPFKGDISH